MHLATNQVVDYHIFARLNFETHHILFAVGNAAFYLFVAQRQRVGHLQTCRSIVLKISHFLAFSLQLFGCIECDVCFVGIEQLLHIFFVDVLALALAVRAVIAAEGNAFVEFDAEPCQRLDDIFFGTGHKALAVSIFDAENQFAAMLFGEQIIVEAGANPADMQRTRRRRCKTNTNFIHNSV